MKRLIIAIAFTLACGPAFADELSDLQDQIDSLRSDLRWQQTQQDWQESLDRLAEENARWNQFQQDLQDQRRGSWDYYDELSCTPYCLDVLPYYQ